MSVETVQGGVPPYGVKETLVVNGKSNVGYSTIYIMLRIKIKVELFEHYDMSYKVSNNLQ